MSVLYFGDPQGALALRDRGIEPAIVVHGRRGGPGWLRLVRSLGETPRLMRPDLSDPAVLAQLRALNPTLIVSCFYPRRIPPTVLTLAPGINAHPSDLPQWRGPDPVTWAIRTGQRQTAICVHVLTEGLDEGDVLRREVVPIKPRESGGRLATRLEARAAELIAEVAAQILAGERPPANPQKGEPTWAPMVPADDWELDWQRPAAEIDWMVRAASPDPGAFTGLGEELLVVFAGRPVDAGRFTALPAGTPFVEEGQLFLRCGEGAYRLDRVRLGRRRMTGRALAKLLV